MKLKEIYRAIVEEGIKADPRGRAKALKELKKKKEKYASLGRAERRYFDREALTNPYSDTRILNGEPDEDIGHIFAGIDIGVGELLIIDALKDKGRRIDLALSHHPSGNAVAGLHNVMWMQADILETLGVKNKEAKSLMGERIREVERKWSSANHQRAVDAARILGIPFLCAHTAADNFVAGYLNGLFEKGRPKTLGAVIDMLLGIPEYDTAMRRNAGPRIVSGSASRKAGRIFVDMTGGTEGPKGIFDSLRSAGIGTLVAMHLSEGHLKRLRASHINLIVAGHIASDNLGLNLLLDRLECRAPFDIIGSSGFRRIRRDGKDTR